MSFNFNLPFRVWEQRKLGKEVENVATGRSTFFTSIEQSSETPYAVLGSTSVISYDKNFDHSGDFILTARVGANAGNLYKYSGDVKISDNTVYIQAKSLDFVYYLLNKFDLKRLSFGTGQPLVKASELKNLKLMFPNDEEEQQKIGKFFKYLDDTIALHQRKLEALKLMKKAFLQQLFPNNDEKVPRLRFADFDEEWDQRKLGDLGSVVMNRRVFKEETSYKGEIPFYKIGTFGGVADSYITRERFEDYKLKYPYPEKGDVLISASGSIGRAVEYNGEEAYYQDSNIVWLKHDKQLNNLFLKQFYSIVKWSGIEGTTIKRLYNKNILQTEIKVPCVDEQKKIGIFFKQLDNNITRYQSKLEKLSSLKKAYLQRMFI
ncbi:restriction endonuclease subunit S [Listeria monocytogenes]|nr:restriction endonuclease subunit S [Listeria monocytogenes]HAO5824525.1 restriction endonuclease subunit S [Listeria monocytogenes]HAO5956902.1 restriction endonuclease subunit S [Listeria monocytogenes]